MPYFEGDFFDVDFISDNGNLLDFSIRKRNNKNQFLFYSTGHKTIKNNIIKPINSVPETILTSFMSFSLFIELFTFLSIK